MHPAQIVSAHRCNKHMHLPFPTLHLQGSHEKERVKIAPWTEGGIYSLRQRKDVCLCEPVVSCAKKRCVLRALSTAR